MNVNLHTLREEIAEHAASRGLVVFESDMRSLETDQAVYWNLEREPDYRRFVAAATAVGAKLITVFSRELQSAFLDSILVRLEQAQLERTERRTLERRIKEIRAYEGFTCHIELSFDLSGRDYIFDLRTEWYDELSDLIDEIRAASEDLEDDDDQIGGEHDGPVGPYFSRN